MHSRNDDVIRRKVPGFDTFGIVGHCTLGRYRFVGGGYGRTVVFVEPRKPYVLHVVLDASSTEDLRRVYEHKFDRMPLTLMHTSHIHLQEYTQFTHRKHEESFDPVVKECG